MIVALIATATAVLMTQRRCGWMMRTAVPLRTRTIHRSRVPPGTRKRDWVCRWMTQQSRQMVTQGRQTVPHSAAVSACGRRPDLGEIFNGM